VDVPAGPTPASPPAAERGPLREVALLFLRLGATAFGGPAAHIALLEDECVHRRRWLSKEQFLDLLGATNLIPGPNSTEMVIHIGYRRAGVPGLVVAGACFILPAFLIVWGLAWLYVSYRTLPPVEAVLYAVKPVMLAVVLQALVRLAWSAVKSRFLAALAVAAVAANALGANEMLVLFAAGVVAVAARGFARGAAPAPLLLAPLATTAGGAAAPAVGLWPLFLFFLKVGSVLYGSGYVLLAFLRADLVDRWGWLTEVELLDAIAIGQVTPGPVFTTATFVGYVLLGSAGAVVATAGIFLPAFVFVALSGPLVARVRRSPSAGAFLDGINVASLALMAVVTWQLGVGTLVDWPPVVLAVVSAVLLLRFKVNSAWLMLGAALLGLGASALGLL
jgi:chromate transporter